MFYAGDLQSGIATALRESKHVVCFVQDDQEESIKWETDFLRDTTLSPLLARNAVLLKMRSASQEAQYLSEIYPLPNTPTLIVIRNGQLKEYLTTGTTKEDFLKRTIAALIDGEPMSASITDDGDATVTGNPASGNSVLTTTASSSTDVSTDGRQSSREVRDLLEERRIKMEAQKQALEAKNKAERVAKAAVRQAELAANNKEDPQASADIKYALMQKKKQQAAREERARILKRVEDDKIARREKESLRREAKAVATEHHEVENSSGQVANTPKPLAVSSSKSTGPATCAVQVRLFDGATIRARFGSEDTLRKHVRKWVDSQRENADQPYMFKLIQAPLPNRTISISEEEESLKLLGLYPSATLVLVPIKDYMSAYEGGATGLVRKSLSTGYAVLSAGSGIVTGLLGSFFGSGGAVRPDGPVSGMPSRNGRSDRDENGSQEDRQLYNGNNLNFEPRRDDDTDKQD